MNHRQATNHLNGARVALRVAHRKLIRAGLECEDSEFTEFVNSLAGDAAGLHNVVCETMGAVKLFGALDRLAADIAESDRREQGDEPCDCGAVRGEHGLYVTHARGMHPDCEDYDGEAS